MTKTLPASEVAQNFDALLDGVAENGDEVLVQKDGHVIAKLVSTREPGPMHGTILYMGDVVSPVTDPEDWDVMK